MRCKLCDNEKLLIKAHIFPEFLYKDLKLYSSDTNGQGRIHIGMIESSSFNINNKSIPVGIYDKEILCKDCDNYINEQYETYSKELLFPINITHNTSYELDPSNGVFKFSGIDYKKFRLFLLSIFWRASISNRQEFYHFNFPTTIENRIKTMLKNVDSGCENEFAFTFFYLNVPDLLANILTPIRTFQNNNGVVYYGFNLGCLFINLNIETSDVLKGLEKYSLLSNGTLNIMFVKDRQNIISYLKKII